MTPIAKLAARFSASLAHVPEGVRIVGTSGVVGVTVVASLAGLGWLSPRSTTLPAPPSPPSPWTMNSARAVDDGACQLSLHVRGPDGAPVADAPLSVVRIADGGAIVERAHARTDRHGDHRLIDLPAGHYDVTVDVAGMAHAGAPTFTCESPGRRASFDVELRAAWDVVSGTVVGRGKRALAAATVTLWQDDRRREGIAGVIRLRSDDDGHFSARLPAGRYVGFVDADNHVRKSIALDVDGALTTELRLAFAPVVRGVVVDETGKAVVGAVVAIGGAFDPKAPPAGSVVTDVHGAFTLPVQEGQRLDLTARGDGRVARVALGIVDDVDALQHVHLVAAPGRTVTGVVQRADGGVVTFGAVHYRVRALGLEGEVQTDANGRFVVDGMPLGEDVEVWAAGNATGAWGAQVATAGVDQLALTYVAPAW